jgi:hypothetical protein
MTADELRALAACAKPPPPPSPLSPPPCALVQRRRGMSDAVKAALRAAVDASIAHDGEEQPPLHYLAKRKWRVAHELAAFLRALPHGSRVPDSEDPEDAGWSWEHWIGRDLAAAVTRAAQEDKR